MRNCVEEIDELQDLIEKLTINLQDATVRLNQLRHAKEHNQTDSNTSSSRATNSNTPSLRRPPNTPTANTPTANTPSASNRTSDHKLAPVDRVIITNNYKGNKGVVSTVERVTRVLVWIKADHQEDLIQKRKNNVKIKGRTCANGSKQRGYVKEGENVASPTVSTEAFVTSMVIDA